MPKRRGPATTLAASVNAQATCQVCHRALDDEPIAWTWSRQRIHEQCVAIWTLASRGRRPLGPWVADTVRSVLERNDGRLCTACLAMALSLSLTEAAQIVTIVAAVRGFMVLPVTCYGCTRSIDALCIVPPASADDVDAGRKCARCSTVLSSTDETVTVGGDALHRGCWRVQSSGERMRVSRTLTRRSRAMIARSRTMLDGAPSPRRPPDLP
jgi:hypothetical protein